MLSHIFRVQSMTDCHLYMAIQYIEAGLYQKAKREIMQARLDLGYGNFIGHFTDDPNKINEILESFKE